MVNRLLQGECCLLRSSIKLSARKRCEILPKWWIGEFWTWRIDEA